MKAIWNQQVIAESDQTIVVEGNHYFPVDSIRKEYLQKSDHTSVCSWKGTSSYYHIVVDDERNQDAAWYYPTPKDAAKNIQDYVAFWKGVEISN